MAAGREEMAGGRLDFWLGRARPGDIARLRGFASVLAFAGAGYREAVRSASRPEMSEEFTAASNRVNLCAPSRLVNIERNKWAQREGGCARGARGRRRMCDEGDDRAAHNNHTTIFKR